MEARASQSVTLTVNGQPYRLDPMTLQGVLPVAEAPQEEAQAQCHLAVDRERQGLWNGPLGWLGVEMRMPLSTSRADLARHTVLDASDVAAFGPAAQGRLGPAGTNVLYGQPGVIFHALPPAVSTDIVETDRPALTNGIFDAQAHAQSFSIPATPTELELEGAAVNYLRGEQGIAHLVEDPSIPDAFGNSPQNNAVLNLEGNQGNGF
jgi:hypothetical protein